MCVCVRTRYEVEAMYFDSRVRAEHQEKLLEALQEALEPAFSAQLRLLAADQLSGFDKDLTVGLVERPDGFSAAAQQAAAAALEGFDAKAQEYLVPGASLTGEVGLLGLSGMSRSPWQCLEVLQKKDQCMGCCRQSCCRCV